MLFDYNKDSEQCRNGLKQILYWKFSKSVTENFNEL